MKIIRYVNRGEIDVEFQDEHKHKVTTTYQNFKIGQIKNPYDRTTFGVGYLGLENIWLKKIIRPQKSTPYGAN